MEATMDITDWSAAKAVWQAVKDSGCDIYDGLVVFVGVGPDGGVTVEVHQSEDTDEYVELMDRVEYLEGELTRLLTEPETESHIGSHLKVLPRD